MGHGALTTTTAHQAAWAGHAGETILDEHGNPFEMTERDASLMGIETVSYNATSSVHVSDVTSLTDATTFDVGMAVQSMKDKRVGKVLHIFENNGWIKCEWPDST